MPGSSRFLSKILARVALAVFVLSALGASLEAADGRGATVNVKLTDGTRAYGELVSVRPDRLIVAVRPAGAETVIALDKIASIEIIRARAFEPRFLNGAALGVFLGLLASSSQRDFHDDYAPTWWPTLFGIGGGLAGLGLEAFGRRSKIVLFDDLPLSARPGALRSLGRYSRERGAGRDWLGGLRISLRPYFHPPLPVRLEGVLSLPEPYPGLALEAVHPKGQSYPNRSGRVRIDYDLRSWLWLGFEYVSFGSHNVSGTDYPGVFVDGQFYIADLGAHGRVASSAALLGVSLGAASGPRAELAAGLAFSSVKDFGTFSGVLWNGGTERSIRMKSRPAFQIGASWEFSPGDPVSGGVFASYLYLRPTLPATTFSGSLNFYPGTELSTDRPVAFQLPAELTFPSQRIDLSGFNFGVFIRLK